MCPTLRKVSPYNLLSPQRTYKLTLTTSDPEDELHAVRTEVGAK
jgi:hypothetical protein